MCDNVDFVDQVALMAWAEEPTGSVIGGGGRYVVVQPGTADVAFNVIHRYQGQGVGAALMRHLAAVARAAGLKQLIAEVLYSGVSRPGDQGVGGGSAPTALSVTAGR